MSDTRACCLFRLTKWTDVLMGTAGTTGKPTADYMYVLELCVSDENKPLLLANSDFIPYLINGLFVDPAHPRADLNPLSTTRRCVYIMLAPRLVRSWRCELRLVSLSPC